MNKTDPELINSTLSQPIERDGKQVQVDIYDDGEGAWILEVRDEYGNSTLWDDSFATEQAALDQAINAIEQEGIDPLIGAPPEVPGAMNYVEGALSEAELDELESFLVDGSTESTAMDVVTVEGFLTAIAIGPRLVPPSEWLAFIWDMAEGKAQPNFENVEQANRIFGLLMRQYNGVLHAFAADPAAFKPLFVNRLKRDAENWCEGYVLGTKFDAQAWFSLMLAKPEWLAPIIDLGTGDGVEGVTDAVAQSWIAGVAPAVVSMHAYWKDRKGSPSMAAASAPVRSGPKIGRNDPCPCGSGKKFKKCCAANDGTAGLH